MSRASFLRGGAGLALCLLTTLARADHQGFYVNNFEASAAGSRWFSAQSAAWKPAGTLSLGLVFDYGAEPVVVFDGRDDRSVALVDHQAFIQVNGAWRLGDRFQVVAVAPLLLSTGGQEVIVGTHHYDAPSGAGLADVKLQGNILILGDPKSSFALFGGVLLWAPIGQTSRFTSDGSVRLGGQLAAAGRVNIFTYAAESKVIWAYKPTHFAEYSMGSVWQAGLALGVDVLDRRLTMGPELSAATSLDDLFERALTPIEVLLGAHYEHDEQWLFGLGVGMGITRGLGDPQYRLLASAHWSTEPPRPAPSATPAVPPPAPSPPPAAPQVVNHGPSDADEDQILDEDDACPLVPGVVSADGTTNGCPASDQDKDGIFDPVDACVLVAGVVSNDAAKNGCPVTGDADADGVADTDDACPQVAGFASSEPRTSGCPRAALSGSRIEINGRIEFENSSSEILAESEPVLSAVLEVMQGHSEIARVNVEGHTDNRGSAQSNLELSRRRAQAVVNWLIAHGIEATRLVPRGLGPNEPLHTNLTETGRRNNRRVEFVIVKFKPLPGAQP